MSTDSTEIRTPFTTTPAVDLAGSNGRLFRKQILPKTSINYNGSTIDFDDTYLTELASSFRDRAYDQVPFLFADGKNQHTMEPERWRGTLRGVELADDGLYGTFELTEDAANLVRENPGLGVSAQIVMNHERSDGRKWPRALRHVLGTLDPRVVGMRPWEAVALSNAAGEVTDLSDLTYDSQLEGATDVSDQPGIQPATETTTTIEDAATDTATDEQVQTEVDDWDEEDLTAFLDQVANEANDNQEGTDVSATTTTPATTPAPPEPAKEPVGASLSAAGNEQTVELAARVEAQNRQLAEVRNELAASRWAVDRQAYLEAGVPPAMLDLAAPVLARHDQEVIELSNGEKSDPSTVLRKLLDAAKGTVDLSAEAGHSVDDKADVEDKEFMAKWETDDPDNG